MNKNKKYEIEQIKYTDNLLKLIGFNNIADYDTTIYTGELDNNTITNINNTMETFKKTFPTKNFNLSKINYQMNTTTQIFAFVKNCLDHISQPYESIRINNKNHLRLKPQNKLLSYYINMNNYTDIRQPNNTDIRQENEENVFQKMEVVYKNIKFPPSIDKQKNNESYEMDFVQITEQKLLENKKSLFIVTNISDIKYIVLENLPTNYTYSLYYGSIKIMDSLPRPTCNLEERLYYDDGENRQQFKQQFNFTRCGCQNDIQRIIFNVDDKCAHINFPWNLYIDVNNNNPNDNFHIYNPTTNKFLYDEYIVTIIDKNDVEHKLTLKPNNTYYISYLANLVENIQLDKLVDIYVNGKFICNNNIVDFADDRYSEYVECNENRNSIMNKFFNNYGINKKWINYNTNKIDITLVSNIDNLSNCIVVHHNVKHKLYTNGEWIEAWKFSM